jgi:hypothetical protein
MNHDRLAFRNLRVKARFWRLEINEFLARKICRDLEIPKRELRKRTSSVDPSLPAILLRKPIESSFSVAYDPSCAVLLLGGEFYGS